MWNGLETRHHLILISGHWFYSKIDDNSAQGGSGTHGYYGSYMNKTFLPTWYNSNGGLGDYNGHVATHKVYMSDAVADLDNDSGVEASSGNWYDTKLSLLSAADFGKTQYGNQYDHGGQTNKLPIFNFISISQFCNGDNTWTRTIEEGPAPTGFIYLWPNGTVDRNIVSGMYSVKARMMFI